MILSHSDVKEICGEFGVHVHGIKDIHRGVYQITTSKGRKYCLKRMPYPPHHLHWIDQTIHKIRHRSSILLGWRHVSKTRKRPLFILYQRTPYVLIPWIEGDWPDPTSSKQMRDCGILLAKFHQCGSTIRRSKLGNQQMVGSWPSSLLEDYTMLQQMVNKAQQNRFQSPLDRMLQANGVELLQMAKSSMKLLSDSSISQLRRKAHALCHGDVGPTNIIRTKKGMYLIDFETLAFDLRAYDLYRFIYNSSHTHNWDFAIAQSILDGYQKVSKLQRSDYLLLKILLRFPRGMCRLIDHYEKREPNVKRQIEHEFPLILAHERKRKTYLKQLDQYVVTYHKKMTPST